MRVYTKYLDAIFLRVRELLTFKLGKGVDDSLTLIYLLYLMLVFVDELCSVLLFLSTFLIFFLVWRQALLGGTRWTENLPASPYWALRFLKIF